MNSLKYFYMVLFCVPVIGMENNQKIVVPEKERHNTPTTLIPTEQEKKAHVEQLLKKTQDRANAYKQLLIEAQERARQYEASSLDTNYQRRKILKHKKAFEPKELYEEIRDGKKTVTGACYNLFYAHVGAPSKKESYSSIHEAA